MDIPGPVELLIIAVVVMVLFGSKKMPDAARSLGRSLRIFKAETKGLQDDGEKGTPASPKVLEPVESAVPTQAASAPAAPAQAAPTPHVEADAR